MRNAEVVFLVGVLVIDNWNIDLNSVCFFIGYVFLFWAILFGGKFWFLFFKGYSGWLLGMYGKRVGNFFVETRIKLG